MCRPSLEASAFRIDIRYLAVRASMFCHQGGNDMAMNDWVLLPVSVFCGSAIATFKSPFEYPWFQVHKLPYLMQLATCYILVRFHKFEVP